MKGMKRSEGRTRAAAGSSPKNRITNGGWGDEVI